MLSTHNTSAAPALTLQCNPSCLGAAHCACMHQQYRRHVGPSDGHDMGASNTSTPTHPPLPTYLGLSMNRKVSVPGIALRCTATHIPSPSSLYWPPTCTHSMPTHLLIATSATHADAVPACHRACVCMRRLTSGAGLTGSRSLHAHDVGLAGSECVISCNSCSPGVQSLPTCPQ
jgi:hypothetical protein